MSARRSSYRNQVSSCEAESTMIARADWVALHYPMLRLRLARFAWCAEGVEARARDAIRAWGRDFLGHCAEDARAIEVSPDRYVRALLDFLPAWSLPLVVAFARRDRVGRSLVPGLRSARIRFEGHDEMIARFGELFARRAVLDPDRVAMIVHVRPAALERARARWAARGIELPPFRMPGAREARAKRPSRDAGMLGRLFAAIAAGEAPLAEDIARIPALQRRGKAARVAFHAALGAAARLPARPNAALLEALPPGRRGAALSALRILAAGEAGAGAELARMSPGLARKALKRLRDEDGGPVEQLRALALAGAGIAPPRGGNAVLLDMVMQDARQDGRMLAALLRGVAGLGRGRRPRLLAEMIAELRPDGFAAFVEAAAPLEPGWLRLPVPVREAALAAWNATIEGQPALRARTAAILPSLALEAARWAGDHRALGAVIAGLHAAAGWRLLARLDAEAAGAAFLAAKRAAPRAAAIPDAWLALAREDGRVLRVLLRHDLARLVGAPLAGLDLAILMAASLRNRRLALRLEEECGAEALAAAMPALRRELAGMTRRIAAAELALRLGWRHVVALAFLATRRYAPAEAPGTRFDKLYRSWEIPKRKGGKRRITAPVPVLKAIQRRLLDAVLAEAPCHPAATGFRPGVSIADNARPHVGRKVVLNVDIEGFFPNTRFKLVRRAVERALPRRLSPEARRLVVDACSMGGGLPIGAPTSPAIANLVMLPVDRALAKVAARHGIAYTRYADDLTLSGDDPARMLPFLRELVGQLGYRLDPKKTNFFRRGRRQVVTGLVVNERVSVPRKLRRRLRAAVHRVATQGATAELEWHGRPMHAGELAGRIAFAGVAHPAESRALAARLREGLAHKPRRRKGGKPVGDAP
ncbi:MAG: reverse transcriptase domain-containing protein [Alphaproteobacteria bacterium]